MSGEERQNPLEMHARLLMGQGRFAEAEAKFREALQGNPLDAAMLHFLALCQYLQDNGEARAVITIRDAIAQQPETAAHHALHAQILTDLQRMEEARQAAEKAVQLDPTDQEAYNNRGFSKKLMGDKKGACEDWNTSKKLGNEEACRYLINAGAETDSKEEECI